MSADDAELAFDLNLPALAISGRWAPTFTERRLCWLITKEWDTLVAPGDGEVRRWEMLRRTPNAAIAVLREAPPDEVGFNSKGAITRDKDRIRLVSLLLDTATALSAFDARLRWAPINEVRDASDHVEADVIEVRRVITEAAVGHAPLREPRSGRVASPSAALRAASTVMSSAPPAGVATRITVRPYSPWAQIVLCYLRLVAPGRPTAALNELQSATAAQWFDVAGGEAGNGRGPVRALAGATPEGLAFHAYYDPPVVARKTSMWNRATHRPEPPAAWLEVVEQVAAFTETHLDHLDVLSMDFMPVTVGGDRGDAHVQLLQDDVGPVMAGLQPHPDSTDRDGYRRGYLPFPPDVQLWVAGGNGTFAPHEATDPCRGACNRAAIRRVRRTWECKVLPA